MTGPDPDPDHDPDLHPALAAFLARERQNQNEHTYGSRTTGIRAFNEWLTETGREPDEITFLDIEDMAEWLTNGTETGGRNVSDRTAHVYLQQVDAFHTYRQKVANAGADRGDRQPIHRLLSDADHGLETAEGVRDAHLRDDERRSLSPAEMEQLIEHAPAPRFRNQLIMRCLGTLGCRPKDLRDLRIEDVDFEHGPNGIVRIRSSKTTNSRTVPMSPQLRTNLRLWLDGGYRASQCLQADASDALIPGERAAQPARRTIIHIVHAAADAAGLQDQLREGTDGTQPLWKITPYSFRKGFATHMKAKVDPKTLQYLMGHKQIETTLRYYTDVTDDDLDRAAAHVPDL